LCVEAKTEKEAGQVKKYSQMRTELAGRNNIVEGSKNARVTCDRTVHEGWYKSNTMLK